jgi:hypothetical protein
MNMHYPPHAAFENSLENGFNIYRGKITTNHLVSDAQYANYCVLGIRDQMIRGNGYN